MDGLGNPQEAANVVASVSVNPYGEGLADIQIAPVSPTREAIGVYSFILPDEATERPGEINVVWTFEAAGQARTIRSYFYVQSHMPIYDALPSHMKEVVQQIRWKIADLFDNSRGGLPNFSEEWQTNFGNERIAQLMTIALGRLNTLTRSAPYTTTSFPAKYSGFLHASTWVEVLLHFMRTYVEQPAVSGQQVAMVDRRDYLNRWQTMLTLAQADAKDAESKFVYEHLNLGGGALLVSGGNFGWYSPYHSHAMIANSARMAYPVARF